MSWHSLGSLTLPSLLNKHAQSFKTQINDLGQAMATGEATNTRRHLQGNTSALSLLQARLEALEGFQRANAEVEMHATLVLTSLDAIGKQGQSLGGLMLSASGAGSSAAVTTASVQAKAAMAAISTALSVQASGKALFSGTAAGQTPLIPTEDLLTALSTAAATATSADDVTTTVLAEMRTAGGLFDTQFYRGGDPVSGGLIDTNLTADALPTAQHDAIRTLLAGAALSALASDTTLNLNASERAKLLAQGAETLLQANAQIAELSGNVGAGLSKIDATRTRQAAEKDALALQRSTMIGADPYETATRLTEMQTQLETLYALTARTSRLNLASFLR